MSLAAPRHTISIHVTLLLFTERLHRGWTDESRPRPLEDGDRVTDIPSEMWVAQCLEHDITGQGTTREEAIESFRKVLLGTIFLDMSEGRIPLTQCPPAPELYQQRYQQARASHKLAPQTLAKVQALPAWMIEASALDVLQVA